MSVRRYTYACKIIIAITSFVIVCTTGCTKQYEYDSAEHLKNAKELLAKSVINNEDWRLIEYHLIKVDNKSTSYKEARGFLPEVQAKINDINVNKTELELKLKQEKKKARMAASPQMRIEYANQYETDYDRIQVGAKAKATGKDNRTLNIYLKYNFDDLVQKNGIYYIHNQWMELGFTKVVFVDGYGASWEKQIPQTD